MTTTAVAIGTTVTYLGSRGTTVRGTVAGHVARPFGTTYRVQARNGKIVHVADVTPTTTTEDTMTTTETLRTATVESCCKHEGTVFDTCGDRPAYRQPTVAIHVFDRFIVLDGMGYKAQEPTTGPRAVDPQVVLCNILRSIQPGQEAEVEFIDPVDKVVGFTLMIDCDTDGVVRISE